MPTTLYEFIVGNAFGKEPAWLEKVYNLLAANDVASLDDLHDVATDAFTPTVPQLVKHLFREKSVGKIDGHVAIHCHGSFDLISPCIHLPKNSSTDVPSNCSSSQR